jgi:hypothetical protein
MLVSSVIKKGLLFSFLILVFLQIKAQPITGIWKGKMGSSKVELKLIRKGDRLIGTSYYYDSKSNYRRYSVKGYFDDRHMEVIWWDDVLIEDNNSHHFAGTGANQEALLAVADFNCPGEGVMKLDGKSSRKNDEQKDKRELHFVKGNSTPVFPDEWDFLIENYAYGVSHPEVVDSIELIAFVPETASTPDANTPAAITGMDVSDPSPPTTAQRKNSIIEQQESVKQPPAMVGALPAPVSSQTNEQKFTSRTKILQQVIPIKGDSVELRFYDNAEIDGDSIAVFLNGRLLREHVLLSELPYIMKIAVADLQSDNELVMVAENLGSIPPNTSLMVAVVEDKRYEAHLRSTEGSSALVRLVKP